jgi:CMP-N,N'-diacetyllegionaminic acid synthase
MHSEHRPRRKILGLVPARGGSKGLERKNAQQLGGRPLIHYTTDVARACRSLTRVVLSTDDLEIASIGREAGVEVPFIRPSSLAQDSSPILEVVRHALLFFEGLGERFDAVCLLEPSTPFRHVEELEQAIQLFWESHADSVVSLVPVPEEYNPHWVYFRDSEGMLHLSTGVPSPIRRRQDLPPAFRRTGAFLITRTDVILQQKTLYGREVYGSMTDPVLDLVVNTPEDLRRAEHMLETVASMEEFRDLGEDGQHFDKVGS